MALLPTPSLQTFASCLAFATAATVDGRVEQCHDPDSTLDAGSRHTFREGMSQAQATKPGLWGLKVFVEASTVTLA